MPNGINVSVTKYSRGLYVKLRLFGKLTQICVIPVQMDLTALLRLLLFVVTGCSQPAS